MIQKITLVIALIIFTLSVAGLEHSEKIVDNSMRGEAVLDAEMREKAVAEGDARCVLRFDGGGTDHGWAGNVKASLSCPGEGTMHTDDWIATRLAGGEEDWKYRNNQSKLPPSVAVVLDETNCPRDEVCYRMASGSIDVTVVNDPPMARENHIYEGDTQKGESALYKGDAGATAVIGFGDFSISKRSARTGRNPQTGKEIQSSGDESDQALANRLLESIKASNCPEDGRERCVVEAVKNSELHSELSTQGEIEILMTLTADPLVVPRKEVSGDCDDSDIDRRPGEVLCGQTTHFLDPDSDGDGLDDLTMVQSGNFYEWKINDKTVANATVNSARAAETQVIFLQADSSEAEVSSKPELVEAIASESGLSKADSKKALDSFVDATLAVELDKSSPYLAKSLEDSTEDSNASTRGGIDKASPKLMEELAAKDARIAELEERIRELESGGEINSTAEASQENGDDPIVRKKPGRASLDDDSDGDGISDTVEEDESDELARRPGFVDRMLASILGR